MGRSVAEIVHLLLAGGWRRRFLICTPILLLPPIGFAVGLFAPKTYETHMTILVQELAKQSPYLGDLTVSTRLQERMPVLMSLVRNPTSLEDVATSLGLISEATSKGERDAVAARLSKGLTMQLIGADLVELRLRGDSASRLIDKLDQIGKKFIERLTAPERSSISDSVEFLERQIDNRRTLLKTAQLRLAEFRSRNGSLLPEVRAVNIERLAKLKQSLEERRIALAGASATVEELQASITHTNPILEQLDKDIARLSFELAQLEARYTQQHPSLNAKRRELRTLEEERQRFGVGISPEKADRLATAEPRALSARTQEAALKAEVRRLERTVAEAEASVANQIDVESELSSLESDVSMEKEIYDKLVKRLELARVTDDLGSFEAGGRVKIFAPPSEPNDVSLPANFFLLAGVIGGVALGLGLAVLAELGDTSLRRRADLERIAGLPLLGRIGRIQADHPPVSDSAASPAIVMSRAPSASAYPAA